MSSSAAILIADSLARLLAEPGLTGQSDFASAWQRVNDLGLTGLLIPEESGGFGGTWRDLFDVQLEVGRTACPLPVGEAVLASWACAIAGFPPLEGLGSVAFECRGVREGVMFSGVFRNVPCGRNAAWIIGMTSDGGWIRLRASDAKSIDRLSNLADEPRDTLTFENVPCDTCSRGDPSARIEEYGVLVRLGQISGALSAALAMTTEHAKSRIQFGKPLGSFQAVQQQLAVFAEEVSAAGCAARAACASVDHHGPTRESGYAIAAAKIRANLAIGVATAAAHQLHGAIGFTADYPLHCLTRRLWSWRTELGNDRFWAARLGRQLAKRGAALLWHDMVDT